MELAEAAWLEMVTADIEAAAWTELATTTRSKALERPLQAFELGRIRRSSDAAATAATDAATAADRYYALRRSLRMPL